MILNTPECKLKADQNITFDMLCRLFNKIRNTNLILFTPRGDFRFTHLINKMTTLISSTNREGSNTLKLTEYYHRQLSAKGFESEILSLTDLPDNFIVTDLYGKRSEAFQSIQDKISATSKFLFIIPEYNGGFPGILKTFIDACKFPDSFYGKKAALVGVSSGKYGNVRGVEHFTGICHYINLHVLPLRLHISAIGKEFDENGDLFKEDTMKFASQQIEQFIAF